VKLVERSCPICGSSDASRIFAEATIDPSKLDQFAFASRKMPEYMHHRLVVCAACDLLYASPAPTAGDLDSAYDEAAFDSQEEARYASETYARLLEPILARLPSRRGALDVGTGDGAFLERLLATGFSDVAGVEPSAAPIAVAQPGVKPLIRHGVFRPGDFTSESLSLVTCFQTIEHLQDPLETCRQFHRLLRPGGAVLLIAHDRRALSARLLGRRSPIFDLEHLQLFSQLSARRLLEAAGFVDVEVRRVVNRYPLHYWVKLFPLPLAHKRPLIEALKTTGIGSVPIAIAAGNLAALGFRAG
jgi:SAM-dependent methyltransferase